MESNIYIIGNRVCIIKGNQIKPLVLNDKIILPSKIRNLIRDEITQYTNSNSKYFITNNDNTIFIEFDPGSSNICHKLGIYKLKFSVIQHCSRTLPRESINIPDDLADRYCLLFRGRVMYHFDKDDYYSFTKKIEESTIVYLEYIP